MSGAAKLRSAAALLAVLALAVAVAVRVMARDDGVPAADVLVEDASRAMAGASFRSTVPACADCAEAVVVDFAPPGSFHVTTPGRFEQWPHYLYLDGDDGGAFVSSEGVRWLIEESAYPFALVLGGDPRFALRVLDDPEVSAGPAIAGRATLVLRGRVDVDAYIAALPPAMTRRGDEVAELRTLVPGTLTLWIDRDDARVLRLHTDFDHGERPDGEATFDFVADADVPARVEAMTREEDGRLGFAAECAGGELLAAIGAYARANGTYPPEATAAVLGLATLPQNPYADQPMAQRPGAPGDFDYQRSADGTAMTLSVWGWDGIRLFYDSARFGPVTGTPSCPSTNR